MKTLLIDSNYLAHQARYTLGGLSKDEIPTGILFGFLNRILYLGKMFRTNDFVFYWDSKKSRRKRLYPSYKEKRTKDRTEEDWELVKVAYEQFNILKEEILPMMGFRNIVHQTGYESDDTIASTVLYKLGEFVVVTADEDLFQLLNYCNIYNPQKEKLFNAQWFQLEYGINPSKWAMVKAIAGCKSDCVEGIAGVGTKTAIKYLKNELKSTTKAYKAITSKDGKRIIQRNLPLVELPFKGTKEPDFKQNQFNKDIFFDICEMYGFESFLKAGKMTDWERFFKNDFDMCNHSVKSKKLGAKELVKARRKAKKTKNKNK